MRVKTLFDKSAPTYDATRRQLLPCFDDFYSTALELIPFSRDANIEILDLGAGTGLLSAMVAEAFSNARLTLVDFSEDMLNKARERFAHNPKQFQYQVMDYAKEEITGPYQVVVSALSIHHLANTNKLALFGKVYHALQKNGIFINADQALGETPAIEQHYRRTWLQQTRALGVSEADLALSIERRQEDISSPLEVQLAWLKQVGFKQAHCWYKNYAFVVYSGQKF